MRKVNSSIKGQVTVFLCIILMVLIILAGVLVDMARIVHSEAQAKRAVASAAKSALAGFDSKLKEDYGFFALYEENNSELKSAVEDYIKRNLMIDAKKGVPEQNFLNNGMVQNNERGETKYLDIYEFRIESLDVAPILNLSENEVVRNQILQYMKYRAPKEMVEGIWDRLSVVKEASSISKACKMQYGVDKLLSKIDKVQQSLKKSIDGEGSPDKYYINGFDRNGNRKDLTSSFAEKAAQCCTLGKNLNELAVVRSQLIGKLGGLKGEEEIEALSKSIMEIEDSISTVQSQLNGTQNERENLFIELKQKQTKGFIQPNIEARRSIDKMMKIAREAEEAVNKLEKYLNEDFKAEGELSASFKSTCKADIIKMKKFIVGGKKAEKMLSDIEENIRLLEIALGKFDQVEILIKTQQDPEQVKTNIMQLLNGNLEKYANIAYDYEKPEKKDSSDDPRKELRDNIGKALKDDKEDKSLKKSGIDTEQLPSKRKVKSPSFENRDSQYLEDIEYTNNYDLTRTNEIAYDGDLTDIDKEADLYDEEGMFTENAFGFLGSMGKVLEGNLSSLMDEIYINEYIMGTFKNSVPMLKYDNAERKDLDLRGLSKSDRNTFFESEVEYILHGNSSEKVNKLMTKSQVLLLRFAMDTIHVCTDTNKRELATAIATAASGWWTGGAGIPILSNLIMCSWGMGEALIDLKDIMDGKPVPFYKSKGDWKLSIGISSLDGKKTDKRLYFSYHDYLRLFLLLKGSDEKISRIEDLIQLNTQKIKQSFEMAKNNTCLRIEADISIRYMFLTGVFMPPEKKTKDGRHLFKVVLYERY